MTSTELFANYLIKAIKEEKGESITHLKLQKLLYYSQGLSYALYGKPLFSEDTSFEAWEHGPVNVEIYNKFKFFGKNELFELNSNITVSKEVSNICSEVISIYGQFSAWTLRNLSHQEAPWKNTPLHTKIPNEAIKNYFQGIYS